MRDDGVSLVAAPETLCAFHARNELARHAFQSAGGAFSKRAAAERKQEKLEAAWEARETMPRELVVIQQKLVRDLLTPTLPGTSEADVRRAAVGALLGASLYGRLDDHERLFAQLLPRELRARGDALQVAEDELRVYIDELPEQQRHQAWEMLASAGSTAAVP